MAAGLLFRISYWYPCNTRRLYLYVSPPAYYCRDLYICTYFVG